MSLKSDYSDINQKYVAQNELQRNKLNKTLIKTQGTSRIIKTGIKSEDETMFGVEIDFIVSDSLAALTLYEKIFEVERIEVSNLPQGENEAVFEIYGTRFHMLDENPEFRLFAPTEDHPTTMWINISVPDIRATYTRAMEAGCTELQAVVELSAYGVSNASFVDPFGYQWMLHEIHEVVSHEERLQLWENRKKSGE